VALKGPLLAPKQTGRVTIRTDGLFLQCGRDVAASFSDIAFEDCMVDALCLRLVKQPETIDVLVLPNQYGDILSGAMLLGHLGEVEAAQRVREAVATVLRDARYLTPDLGGRAWRILA